MIKEEFGRLLAESRKQKGLTQEQLAGDSNVGQRFLQELEQGKKQPSITTLFKLANTLGTTPADLLGPAWRKWTDDGCPEITD